MSCRPTEDAAERGPGATPGPDAAALPARRAALLKLSRPVAGAHDRRKQLPARVVERVFANAPFEDYPGAVARSRQRFGRLRTFRMRREAPASLEDFLRGLFPPLKEISRISFAAESRDAPREAAAVQRAAERYSDAGLSGQAQQLREAYDGLRALRCVFSHHKAGQQGFSFVETVVPARYLPELLVAAPVWFIGTKGRRSASLLGPNAVAAFCGQQARERGEERARPLPRQPRAFPKRPGPSGQRGKPHSFPASWRPNSSCGRSPPA